MSKPASSPASEHGATGVALRHVAHARSGDKGNTSNIAVIAWSLQLYPVLSEQLTVDAFTTHYAGVIKGTVTRYEVARLGVLNFVAEGALGGGVSRSLVLDQYGKTLAAGILNFQLAVPYTLLCELRAYART